MNSTFLIVLQLIISGSVFAAGSTSRIALNVSSSKSDSGYAYILNLASPPANIRLFENGIEIGPSKSLHDDIRKLGKGRFSLDGTRLRFSASNNSNPARNGRKYSYLATTVSTPVPNPTPTPTPTPTPVALTGLMGYANEGGQITTGGAGGSTVTVTTLVNLKTALSDSTARIIQISGIINGNNDNVYVGSNKTIIGLKGAELRAYGLYLSGASNVIIQNLKMVDGNGGYSPLAIKDASHHVWVDHCEFYPSDNPDNGHTMASVTRDAQYVTFSWSKFEGKYTGLLIGASTTDAGPFYVTLHHNLFVNMLERQPKVSNGRVHIFNNYYKNAMTNGHTPVGITSVNGAIIRTDNNYFENFQGAAISTEYNYPSEAYGSISGLSTNYKDAAGSFHITTPASTWTPPYSYTNYLTPVMNVPAVVTESVGATLK